MNSSIRDRSSAGRAEGPAFPVASGAQVRRTTGALTARHGRVLVVTTALFLAATGCSLIGPWLLNRIIDDSVAGTTSGHIAVLAGTMLTFLLLRACFTFAANRSAVRLGEVVFAELREGFIGAVLRLPLSTVESCGTGDLLTRTTRDVDQVSRIIQFGIPQILASLLTIVVTVVACVLTGPLLSLSIFVAVPLLLVASRWYLRRSAPAYRAVSEAYSALNQVVAANTEGARTIDALRLGPTRRRAVDDAIHGAYTTSRRTLFLRTVLFPVTNFAFSVPVAVTLLWGEWLVSRGLATAGAVAAVCLYVLQLASPVEELINWLDAVQSGNMSLARLVGVGYVPSDRTPTDRAPEGDAIELSGVTYAYRPRQPVLHEVSLSLVPGERLAVVGESGSGKSTLARLIAGITSPVEGTVTIGGMPIADRPLPELRREVALLTQEHHIFFGSIAENVRLARPQATDEQVLRALSAIGAHEWVLRLPEGTHTQVGSGARQLTPTEAQQIALARLVLLDPKTLVLDEATAMLDSNAARTLERSMAVVMTSRTVVAITHRLHTTHDADRIALMVDGRIAELGTHDALLARRGHYAELWRAWQHAE